MVQYLRRRGRQRIGMITGPLDTPGGVDRLAGYLDVLGDADATRSSSPATTSATAARPRWPSCCAQAPDLDAVFVASDLMAAGALTALRRAGRRVPEDVAVGGFDDSSIATTVEPALTTIRQPMARHQRRDGAAAARPHRGRAARRGHPAHRTRPSATPPDLYPSG